MQDEDVKIASDNPSESLRPQRDYGETVAKEFQRHKENGNIFMANRLGEELAKPLLGGDEGLFDNLNLCSTNQLYFLYGFAVRKAVNEGIEVSILADTVLHSFSETVKNRNEAIYAALNDSVSDTVYRLCLSDDSCIGTGFAKLCGQGSNSRWVELGCESYQTYRDFSAALVKKFVFKK